MTRISLETCYGASTIEVFKDDMTIEEVMQELVAPVLLASGYHPNSVHDYIEEE